MTPDNPNIDAMKDRRDVDGLIKALRDDGTWVRVAAVEALGEIGDPRAVEPLIAALLGDRDVRRAAAEGLERIRSAK